MNPLRDLLKHSSVYAAGQILTRMASVVLLPMYTRCLTAEDYGVTAILDLTSALLWLLIGGGIAAAVTRFHFDDDSAGQADRVWWTGLVYVLVSATVILAPLFLARQTLSDLTLGTEQQQGAWFYVLTLSTVWFSIVGSVLEAYLRVRKWSGLFVLTSMGRLLLNVGLNVWLLAFRDCGIEGLLWGNLTATVLHTVALLTVFVLSRGPCQIDLVLAGRLFRFCLPLVVTGLLAMLMHEADRFVLRALCSLHEVGVYALAHKLGFAVHTLCLLPFLSIWHVAIYDIDRMPDAPRIFRQVCLWFAGGFGITLLGASLLVHPLLPLLTSESFHDSTDLVAVILLGFYFFGLQMQFEVPAMLCRRPGLLVPGSVVGVCVNLAANILLVPAYGVWGAAWAGVVTYAGCAFTILILCRRLRPIRYPWCRSLLIACGLCLTYAIARFWLLPRLDAIGQTVVSTGLCGVWAIVLFGRDGVCWWCARRPTPAAPDLVAPDPVASELRSPRPPAEPLCETVGRSEVW